MILPCREAYELIALIGLGRDLDKDEMDELLLEKDVLKIAEDYCKIKGMPYKHKINFKDAEVRMEFEKYRKQHKKSVYPLSDIEMMKFEFMLLIKNAKDSETRSFFIWRQKQLEKAMRAYTLLQIIKTDLKG